MATAALSRVVRGGASAGLAAHGLLSAGLSKAPRQSPSLPTTVLSRVFCSNGNEKCFKIADLVEMNNRIDIVENELKYKVQLLEFKLESERAWARVEMMEEYANKMEFRFKLMYGIFLGGSVAYLIINH